ncbi:hypothetical protein C4552_04765 [Candidatus Parcubacteria bacterium]|nr:MAG: hypothetical protein C4552_04765 [Candidatus Parcubacteria bacterium]
MEKEDALLTKEEQEVALILHRCQVNQFSRTGFLGAHHAEHPDAPPMPDYIQTANLYSFPADAWRVAEIFAGRFGARLKVECDLIMDVPRASTPFVAYVAVLTGIPMIMPQYESKQRGIDSPFTGVWVSGQRVGIIDGVKNTGLSLRKAIAHCRKHRLVPTFAGAITDRGTDEEEFIDGVPSGSLLRWRRALDFYESESDIPADLIDASRQYPDVFRRYLWVKNHADGK